MKKGKYKWQYSTFITQYNLNQFNISLQTDEILPLAQCMHTSLCLCSQPAFPLMLNWLHVWQPCHLLWHLSRHFLCSLTSNLTSSASERWKGSGFMSKGQRNAIKAVPFTDHEPLWQTQFIMLQSWKAGNYQKWGAMLLISCKQPRKSVDTFWTGWWGYWGLCAGEGQTQRRGRGQGRETPMAAPACSNKTQSCDAWAEVCFSESGTWQGCWWWCLAEYKELLVGLLVTCPGVLPLQLCFLVSVTWSLTHKFTLPLTTAILDRIPVHQLLKGSVWVRGMSSWLEAVRAPCFPWGPGGTVGLPKRP